MPSVPLMRARPSFSSSSTGAMPAAASASARRHPLAVRVAHDALAHQRERAVRERGEVAGAAERAVLVHDRGDAGVQHRDVGGEGLLADAGAAGRQRRDAQQHQRAHHLALDLGAGAGRVRADQRALQLAAHRDRDVPGGQGAEAGGDAVVRLGVVREAADHLAGAAHLGQGLLGQHDRGAVAGDPHDLVDGQRAGAEGDRLEPGPRAWRRGRAPVGSASEYDAGEAGTRASSRGWWLRSLMSSIGAPATPPCTGAGPAIPSRQVGRDDRPIGRCYVRGTGPRVRRRGPARSPRPGPRTGHRRRRARRACPTPRAGRRRAPRSGRRRARSTAGGRW